MNHSTELLRFTQQPNASESASTDTSCSYDNVSYAYYVPESYFTYQFEGDRALMEAKREAVMAEEINRGVSHLLRKFGAKLLRGQSRQGKGRVSKKRQNRMMMMINTTTSRGGEGVVGELIHRLDRFKIRTVHVGGGGCGGQDETKQ